jgi:hypothetical protein
MARFETETLSTKENLKHLMDLSGQWIDQAHQHRRLTKLILDMDSSVSETYGHQQGSAYNGHFGCTCYHPLFLFNQFGDLERVLLRRGNCGSAKYWRRVLLPVIERYRGLDIPKFFRGDAAFAGPKLLRVLASSVAASQTRTVWSEEALARRMPSGGLKATLRTARVCPRRAARTSWPLSASQTRTVSSEEALARRRPSGLKATL